MMLSVEAIEAGYGGARVLQGVDFNLGEAEALALLGRNGMGKTTTVRALFGLLPLKAGRIVFEGAALSGRPPYAIARAGLGLVPEGAPGVPDPHGPGKPRRDGGGAPGPLSLDARRGFPPFPASR
jgi:ABC-type branched-subunit amino acid transport system ATPase component